MLLRGISLLLRLASTGIVVICSRKNRNTRLLYSNLLQRCRGVRVCVCVCVCVWGGGGGGGGERVRARTCVCVCE